MSQLPPPESFDDHTLVEYVESALLVEGEGHLSLAELVSRFPSGQRPTSADTGLIRSEVMRRAFLLPEIYPFRADDAGVFRLANRTFGPYDFLLLVSIENAPYRLQNRYNEANKIFDLLVREALKARLTPGGDAVRFGTPVQDGRPQLFEQAVPWLAERMGLAVLATDLPVDDNDAGVDVVAWHPFASGRSGFPVWLVQCTLQMNFENKALQIPLELWKQMIDIGPHPGTALAIPFTVRDGDDRWMKVNMAVTSLLDRIRICEMLVAAELAGLAEFSDLGRFVAKEIDLLQDVVDNDDAGQSAPAGARRKAKVPRVSKPRRQREAQSRHALRR